MTRRDQTATATRPAHASSGLGTPDLEPGLTLLRRPTRQAPDVHALVVERLAEMTGEVLWIDARDTASTHLLYDLAPHERALEDVRIARAWTAYQHHSLVRAVVRKASSDTSLVVAPAVGSLYRDDDLPDWEAADLMHSALTILREVGRSVDVPVLASTAPELGDASDVAAYADREIRCRKTHFGYAFEGDGFETTVYWGDGWFQTTIPYWVDLLGPAGDDVEAAAYDAGLLEADL